MRALHSLVLLASVLFSIPSASARNSTVLHTPWKEQSPLVVDVKGDVDHQIFRFPSRVAYHRHFRNSESIFAVLVDHSVWQSSDGGYTWTQILPHERISSLVIHPYSDNRAYLLTHTEMYYHTINGGHSWTPASAPSPPSWQPSPFAFHPSYPDYLIWVGGIAYPADGESHEHRHTEAFLSKDNGVEWKPFESHVTQCLFAVTLPFEVDDEDIICAAYRDRGMPQIGSYHENPLQLILGHNWYLNKHILFENIIEFDKLEDRVLVVARDEAMEIEIYASSSAGDAPLFRGAFVKASFPSGMQLERQLLPRVVQATEEAVFLGLEVVGHYEVKWTTLLKSNYLGTNYTVSLDHITHTSLWGIDYAPMPGMPGTALAGILSNPDEVFHSGEATTAQRKLQTRITYNDGGHWSPLRPPARDSNGVEYPCHSANCSLHFYSPRRERIFDGQSDTSTAGLMLAMGNVGEFLAPLKDASMFLTRDGGWTWDEVHKGHYEWAFGDSGSILVIVDGTQPTDHVRYSADNGLHWGDHNFGIKLRVTKIMNIPGGTTRKFMLIGTEHNGHEHRSSSAVVHLDFTELTREKCKHDPDPEHDDFERWSPHWGERRLCMMGAQVSLHRKKQSANCYIGDGGGQFLHHETSCVCTDADYECEYNHVRDRTGKCVLAPGIPRLTATELCTGKEWFWSEPAAYRKIAASYCIDGYRLNPLDRPIEHFCPGDLNRAYRKLLWWLFILNAIAFIPLVSFWCYRRRKSRKGYTPVPTSQPRMMSTS